MYVHPTHLNVGFGLEVVIAVGTYSIKTNISLVLLVNEVFNVGNFIPN